MFLDAAEWKLAMDSGWGWSGEGGKKVVYRGKVR